LSFRLPDLTGFSRDRLVYSLVRFKPHEQLAAVSLGEALDRARAMLRRTAGDADVERAIAAARHHVDAGTFHARRG